MFELTHDRCGGPNAGFESYRAHLHRQVSTTDDKAHCAHAVKQIYIAPGTAPMAVAEERIDFVPMEGFDDDALSEDLGLRQQVLRSVVMPALACHRLRVTGIRILRKRGVCSFRPFVS